MVTKEELKAILTEAEFAYVSNYMSTDESGNVVDLSEQLFGRDGIMTAAEIKEYVSAIVKST